jgi:hypothetical protein
MKIVETYTKGEIGRLVKRYKIFKLKIKIYYLL